MKTKYKNSYLHSTDEIFSKHIGRDNISKILSFNVFNFGVEKILVVDITDEDLKTLIESNKRLREDLELNLVTKIDMVSISVKDKDYEEIYKTSGV